MRRKGILNSSYRVLAIVTLICISIGAQAQLLWEITGKDLEKPSYLFGTHHAIPVSYLDSVKDLYKCYNQCTAVVGEIDMDQESFNNKFMKAAVMTNSLSKLMSESDYQLVDSVCQAVLKIPLKAMDNFKPSVVSNMLELAIYEQVFPNQVKDGQMDSFFQHLAEQQNHKVYGLESMDDQIDLLFRSQSLERQTFLLVGVAKSVGDTEENYRELNDLYRNGDIEALFSLYVNDTSAYKATIGEMFLFLEQRNQNWVDKLPALMRREPCFIAVGALHLPGETGVINLLRKKGYKVTAVR